MLPEVLEVGLTFRDEVSIDSIIDELVPLDKIDELQNVTTSLSKDELNEIIESEPTDEDVLEEIKLCEKVDQEFTKPPCEWNTRERGLWISKNEKFLYFLVNKYKSALPDNAIFETDDLFQNASISAVRAMNLYDHTRSVKFTTYVAHLVKFDFLMEARKYYASKRKALVHSLDAPQPETEDAQHGYDNMDHSETDALHQYTPSVEEMYDRTELEDFFFNFYESRCDEEEKIIFKTLEKTITQKRASTMLKCSQAKVSQKAKALRCKLVYALHRAGFINA